MSIPPTLLLADDSLTIQRVVSLTFADQPVRLVVAKDGQDAINRMTKERPDLVLADTNMPCVDGYELARWVRDQPHLSTVPVLLLAGVADPVDEQRLHDSGANGVLEKPFEPSHVISRVKELLGLKGGSPAASGGRLVTAPIVDAAPAPVRMPEVEPRPADSDATEHTVMPSQDGVANIPTPAGDARDWFAEEATSLSSGPSGSSLTEEPGLSVQAADGTFGERGSPADTEDLAPPPSSFVGPSRPHAVGSPADVFESLLAAEQGQGPHPVLAPTSADLSPAVLDDLATRVAERLGPALQSMSSELRDALVEAAQAAITGAVAGNSRDSVNESVVNAIRDAVGPAIRDTVREAVEVAVRAQLPEALASSVPGVVMEAIRGEGGNEVRALVRETAERLIAEEIARIRQPRS